MSKQGKSIVNPGRKENLMVDGIWPAWQLIARIVVFENLCQEDQYIHGDRHVL